MSSNDPVPAYFGLRYVLWFMWSNAITLLMTLQVIVSTLALDPTLLPDKVTHWMLIANAVLVAILAQIRRDRPPPSRPLNKPKENSQ